jgi:hypothetical protein
MVFPEPGRSDRPALDAVDLRLGIPDTESPRSLRLLTGPCDFMVTSSDISVFMAMDFGRTLPARSKTLPGEFSLRIGEPSRVGVGMADACLMADGVVRKGVCGSALDCRVSRDLGSGLRGDCEDHVGTSLASCKVLRSLNEERRFLRGGPAVGGTSPIVPRAPTKDRLLPVTLPFSKVKAPSTVGRSREEGRFGDWRPALETLEGWLSGPWLFLLKERHREPTFDSFSDLLFSLVKVPKPKRFLKEVLELIEPPAVERPLESTEP